MVPTAMQLFSWLNLVHRMRVFERSCAEFDVDASADALRWA